MSRQELKVQICDYFTAVGIERSKLASICEAIKWVADGTMGDEDIEWRAESKFSPVHRPKAIEFAKVLCAIKNAEASESAKQREVENSRREEIRLAKAVLKDPTATRSQIKWANGVLK